MSIKSVLVRGTVALADSLRKLQSIQLRLLAGEVKDGVEHMEPYGFTASPLAGAEALAGFIDGDRSHGVVIVISDRRFRLQGLQPGEVALYTDEGDFIHFKRGQILDIQTGTLNIKAAAGVHFDTPTITQTGTIVSDGDQVAGSISQIGHVHGQVKMGEDQSGVPVGGGG